MRQLILALSLFVLAGPERHDSSFALTGTPAEVSLDRQKESVVYVTKTGEKYHSDGCRYLKSSKIPLALSEASGSRPARFASRRSEVLLDHQRVGYQLHGREERLTDVYPARVLEELLA